MQEPETRETRQGRRDDAAKTAPSEPYGELFLGAPYGIAFLAPDGRVLDVNPAGLKIHGHPRDQIVGRPFSRLELLFPEDVPRLEGIFARALAGEMLPPLEVRLKDVHGGTRWIEATLLRGTLASAALQVHYHDVTRHKEAERTLSQSVDRYRILMESAADGIVVMQPDGTITEVNPSLAALVDVPPGDLVGRHLSELIAPEDLAAQPLRLHEIREGRTVRVERTLRRRDGQRRIAEIVARLLEDGRILGVVRDATSRIAGEQALEASEQRLRAAITSAPVILFALDREGRFTFSEGKGLEGLGLLPGEVVGRSVFELYADVPAIHAAVRRALAGESVDEVVSVGGLDWETHYAPVRGRDGEVASLIGISQDITERRRVERALRRSEARYRALAEHTFVGIWQCTLEGHTIYMNPAMLELLEVPAIETLSGVTYHRFFTPETVAAIEHAKHVHVEGEPHTFEAVLVSARGHHRDVVVAGAPIRDSKGNFQSLIGTFVDVTERRQLEQRVQKAQKLESLGILAGGIAHDFNNLLTGVLGNAGLALDRLEPGHRARPVLHRIEQAARWAAELVQQLHAYAGRRPLLLKRVDLSAFVREMGDVLASTTARGVDLVFELADDAPEIEVDAAQLRQLVLNLVQNASEACAPGGGRVRVRTGAVDVDAAWLQGAWLGEGRSEGPHALLEVADDGRGMDAETQRRLFDPFFTTKASGRGLGLATVLGIIRSHGGAIRVASAPEAGATFTVALPLTRRLREESMKPDAAGRAQGTVLVVEDEDPVRDVVLLALEGAGYRVIEAKSAQEGWEAFAAAGGVSMVVLDAHLPGLGGPELVQRLRETRPGLPVLLISGALRTTVVSEYDARGLGPLPFLEKPFPPQDLVGAVRTLLGAS